VKLIAWCSAALVGFLVVATMTAASLVGSQSQALGAPIIVSGIPPEYLQLYIAAAQKHKLDWSILAAIGKVETDHGRIQGGACATSSAGARGPMQFMPATWAAYGNGGDVCDPSAAIPAAARYLVAGGAPKDYRRAIFAYNHADWYVRKVLDQAEKYRRAAAAPAYGGDIGSASVADVLSNPRIHLTPGQRRTSHVPRHLPSIRPQAWWQPPRWARDGHRHRRHADLPRRHRGSVCRPRSRTGCATRTGSIHRVDLLLRSRRRSLDGPGRVVDDLGAGRSL
jgi:hypothetical protein